MAPRQVYSPLRKILPLIVILIFTGMLFTHTSIKATGNCGLTSPAFCDSFDSPSTVFNRSGQLDGNIWGVSRFTGNTNGFGSLFDAWSQTQTQLCDGSSPVVQPPNDIIICNGQVREATTDNGTVTVLAMYPKQPFDFAGRTGKVTFDISNDTQGSHDAWPEFWVSDKPVPAPFSHEDSWGAYPQHGFGIRFAAFEGPCGAGKWTVDGAVVSRNYVPDGDTGAGLLAPNSTLIVNTKTNDSSLDCVTLGSFNSLNHIEVRVSQAAIDVWATDAGQPTLKHIANIPNANLSFTRGLVWIQDAHYNANKFAGDTRSPHTFAWDNVGFDGPFTYRDASYDVLDALTNNGDGTFNLGWKVHSGQHLSVNTLPLDAGNIAVAMSARLLMNILPYSAPQSFTYIVNGHQHSATWPYPDTNSFGPRTIAFDVPLADLISGPNHIEYWSPEGLQVVANVGIVLVNIGGAVSTPTATSTSLPTSTPTPSPSATPTPTAIVPTGTPLLPSTTPTSTPTALSTPISVLCYRSLDGGNTIVLRPGVSSC